MSKATIFVQFRQTGFHSWPEAIGERAYLANVHRHIFHVHVETSVRHDNREIEFHDLLDAAQARFLSLRSGQNGTTSFGGQSCEMLARRLGSLLADQYQRPFTVTVSEDGECGASIECEPTHLTA